jgi:hypothetical protein
VAIAQISARRKLRINTAYRERYVTHVIVPGIFVTYFVRRSGPSASMVEDIPITRKVGNSNPAFLSRGPIPA